MIVIVIVFKHLEAMELSSILLSCIFVILFNQLELTAALKSGKQEPFDIIMRTACKECKGVWDYK